MTAVTAWAPGRVNLIGEHVDYNGGLVLPIAIDRGTSVRVEEREAAQLVIRSRQMPDDPRTVEVADLAPGAVTGWAAYVAGAVWALALRLGRSLDHLIESGLEIEIDSDVPLGAGLSSSAAVECAVVTALAELWGATLSRRELARVAQQAENEFVGVPTGSMDQVASMMGASGCALLFDVARDRVEPIELGWDGRDIALVVIDTRAAHALVDGGYAARRATCESAARRLGVDSLREVTDLDEALSVLSDDPVAMARTRHVVTEIGRVERAVAALRRGDDAEFGALMDASHRSLRDDFHVSCPELEVAVEQARRAGAWGARMTGGGFGGSAIAMLPCSGVEVLAEGVRQAFADHGWTTPGVWRVRASSGATVTADPM